MAASECGTTNFETSGPQAFLCPPQDSLGSEFITTEPMEPPFLDIFLKVQSAAFLWGLGTALGELPPYFVARAAQRSGKRITELMSEDEKSPSSVIVVAKNLLFFLLDRYGFWAIVLCASVPNPLFDLAGLACGHFEVEFWRFFGATLIGKALIKSHLQAGVIIFLFNKTHLQQLIRLIEDLVPQLKGQVQQFFDLQRRAFHSGVKTSRPLVGKLWDLFLVLMILGFLKSIVESLVQERLEELDEEHLAKLREETEVSRITLAD